LTCYKALEIERPPFQQYSHRTYDESLVLYVSIHVTIPTLTFCIVYLALRTEVASNYTPSRLTGSQVYSPPNTSTSWRRRRPITPHMPVQASRCLIEAALHAFKGLSKIKSSQLPGILQTITCWRYFYGVDRFSPGTVRSHSPVPARERSPAFHGTNGHRTGTRRPKASGTRTGVEPWDTPQRPACIAKRFSVPCCLCGPWAQACGTPPAALARRYHRHRR
jgi:hypothetical protein